MREVLLFAFSKMADETNLSCKLPVADRKKRGLRKKALLVLPCLWLSAEHVSARFHWLRLLRHTGYRDTTNATGYNERSWKWWRHKNMFGTKMIYFSLIPNLLGWLFCIAAGKQYYLLQIQLQENLFMTNENKNIFFFFLSSVFLSTTTYFGQYFLTVKHFFVPILSWFIYCWDSKASVDAFLRAPGSVNVHWIQEWCKAWHLVRVQLTTGYDRP